MLLYGMCVIIVVSLYTGKTTTLAAETPVTNNVTTSSLSDINRDMTTKESSSDDVTKITNSQTESYTITTNVTFDFTSPNDSMESTTNMVSETGNSTNGEVPEKAGTSKSIDDGTSYTAPSTNGPFNSTGVTDSAIQDFTGIPKSGAEDMKKTTMFLQDGMKSELNYGTSKSIDDGTSYTAPSTNGPFNSTGVTDSAIQDFTGISKSGAEDMKKTTMFLQDGMKSELNYEAAFIAPILVVLVLAILGFGLMYYCSSWRKHTYFVVENGVQKDDITDWKFLNDDEKETDTNGKVEEIKTADNTNKIVANQYELVEILSFQNVNDSKDISESDVKNNRLNSVYELAKLPFDDQNTCANIDDGLYDVVDENEIQIKGVCKEKDDETYDDAASVAIVRDEKCANPESCDDYDHVCRNARVGNLSKDYDYAHVDDNTYDEAEAITSVIAQKKRPSYPDKIEENIYEDDPEYSELDEQENMCMPCNYYDYSCRSKCVVSKQDSSGKHSGYSDFRIVNETDNLYDTTESFKRMGSDPLVPTFPLNLSNIDENYADKVDEGPNTNTSDRTKTKVSNKFDNNSDSSVEIGLATKEQKPQEKQDATEILLLDDDLYTLVD